METQTFTLLLCLAAQATAGLLFRIFAWFLYSGLLSPGPSWAMWPGYLVRQVNMAQWSALGLQLVLASVAAVRADDVDLSVLDAHADPAVLRMSGPQASVTL
jgi:hypothetical protein